MHYLIAAEQGNKEGQASLAWLLDKSMAAGGPTGSSPFAHLRRVFDRLRGTGSSSTGSESSSVGDVGDGSRERLSGGEAGVGVGGGVETKGGTRNRRSGIGGVVDAVRELGGDPEAMVRRYRRLAAEQGDSEAR